MARQVDSNGKSIPVKHRPNDPFVKFGYHKRVGDSVLFRAMIPTFTMIPAKNRPSHLALVFGRL